ncbi:MAG: hypothetical protein HOE93_00860 [Nitrosopumilus sp.]|nr:hypothetical protein [Nitrosopumilus sp.]
MKSILIILVVLFFVITPVHGQLLSDATGLVNRLDVQTSGYSFEVKLTSNFDLTDFTFDKDQKQIILYLDSGLENNLGEIIIPQNLLTGDFTFYLNEQEFFPKIQSNEEINFVTLNFTGSGTNVVKIIGSEYLVGLIEIPFESDPQKSSETNLEELPEIFSSGYFVWLILGGILIIVVAYVIIKIQKNKN